MAFAVFAAAAVCGMIAVRALDPKKRLYFGERIIALIIAGFTVFGFLTLALSAASGNLSLGIWGAVLFAGFLAVVFRAHLALELTNLREGFGRMQDGRLLTRLILVVLLLMYLAVVWNVMIRSADGTPQGVLKGWGDAAYHMNIIEFLATISPFRLEQPIVGGAPLTYPFFIDFWSAIFRKIGLSLFAAWHIPVILFGISLFFLVFYFGKRLLERDSFAIALAILTFFGGGIGFLWFFQDISSAWRISGISGIIDTFFNLPHEYTHMDIRTGGKPSYMSKPMNIVWIVPAISFFSHQRSFVVGSAVGFLMLLGVFLYWHEPKVMWRWLALAGFLPMTHTHTFLALAVITLPILFLSICRNFGISVIKWWVLGGSIALVIALPQIYLLASGGALGEGFGSTFFKPWLGWMAEENIFWFWTKNFGIVFWGWMIVLLWSGVRHLSAPASAHSSGSRRLLLGAVIPRFARTPSSTAPPQLPQDTARRSFSAALLVASMVIFAVSHLVKFQPWEFDNNKVIFYWWFFASVILLSGLGVVISRVSRKWVAVLAVGAIIAIGSFSGFLDIFGRITGQKEHYGYYGASEIEAAEWIRENTRPADIFLTAESADAFVPMLSGRAIYLGYSGWLWSQGRWNDVERRASFIKKFLVEKNPGLICRDGVGYIVWDQGFASSYPDAKISKVEHLLEPVFRQDTPYGERTIYRILCENL